MITKLNVFQGVKILIVLGIWWAVLRSWPKSIQHLQLPDFSLNVWVILVILGVLNWVLEWFKWHRLAGPISPGSHKTRWKEVSKGFLLGQGIPLGDWIGRLTHWPRKTRPQGWALNAYASSWQSVVTVGGALMCTSVFFSTTAWYGVIPLYMIYLGLHFFTRKLRWREFSFPPVRSWEIGGLSLARHAVLSLQAVIFSNAWGLDLSTWTLIAAWQWIWLGKMIGGLLNVWGELGTRQWSGVFFLGLLGISSGEATAVIWSLWILNNSLPFFMGSIYWLRTWKSSTVSP